MVLASSEKLRAVPLAIARDYDIIARPATKFLTPAHWKSPIGMNPHADGAQAVLCAWMRRLCLDMEHWTSIATQEAQAVSRYQRVAILPSFEDQLELRIVTIGMYPTTYLIEAALDWEFCDDFHARTSIKTIRRLAGLMVGIGNDIFSLGKDLHENKINLVATLTDERGITARDAIDYLIGLHNDAVLEFDAVAAEELARGSEAPDRLSAWLRLLRYSCAGFTHWESRAERYTEYCVLDRGRIQALGYL